MHSSAFLLVVLRTATLVASADLADQILQPMAGLAIVQNVVTLAMPSTEAQNLDRRSDESCDKARKAMLKIAHGLSPTLEPTLESKLSSYMSEHPEITMTTPSDFCSATAGPSITGPLGSVVTEAERSVRALWSSITPDIQSMWSECSTVERVSSALVSDTRICPSVLADMTGKPKQGTQAQNGALPRETGAMKVALGIAGMAIAAIV